MSKMNLPGFTAEVSHGKTRGHYQSVANRVYTTGGREIVSQLAGSGFSRPRGGGVFGGLGDYWVCKSGCEATYSACLDTCEGTWENPKPSRNCLICDENYWACLQACSGDIA
ncbi:MAG: hypothetical protein ACREOW_13055 [Thermodesulfobacteriota bacterium]